MLKMFANGRNVCGHLRSFDYARRRPTSLRVCDFFPHCHPERREARAERSRRTPHTMAAPVASRAFSRHRLRQVVAENVSTVVAPQADTGCFDSTAACAALALSMTGVERINKVTHSQDDILLKAEC